MERERMERERIERERMGKSEFFIILLNYA